MATIHVDGESHEVDGADNLLQACLSLGMDIPYFCWHPALGSVGACRQCAVKQYSGPDDTRGRLVMSCMTQSTDNTWISIDDAEAKAFRESVVEWLMTNHPHDCPVCEEGGHCHLQDMTVMTGHNMRRYRFSKRTHNNQDLGPFINHEMNRCIACYRCVRYYKDYAGGTDLGVYGAHDNVYFGRESNGVLESEFSGNLTEVCPTGVFTDKTHSERYNRKWDMQFAPSICQQCSVGCNTSPGERYGELRRIENRYNGSVNHYFLCDRGRFGYGYVNDKNRPRRPLALQGSNFHAVSMDHALDSIARAMRNAGRVIGIGSPRASLETNFALQQLVGADNFYSGMAADELARVRLALQILQQGTARTPSLREMESCDAVFVLGEDVTQTAPRIALALRQSVKTRAVAMAAEKKLSDWQAEAIKCIGQHELSPLFIASFDSTRLDDVAVATVHGDDADIARLGFAVAHAIDDSAPAVDGLSGEQQALAQQIAAALLAAAKPLVVSGTSSGSEAVLRAAANISAALVAKQKAAGIALVVPEVNSLGVAMLGGESVEAALDALRRGQADTVIIVENDLHRRVDARTVDLVLNNASVIVLDHQQTRTTDKALFVLPAASFAEGDGTVVNMEGRAQRYFQVYDLAYYQPETLVREGWRWLQAIAATLNGEQKLSWLALDDVTAACAAAYPALAAIVDAAPDARFRIMGSKLARAPRRYSGRTAMRANLSVHEPRAPQDQDSALAFSMEGITGPYNTSSLVPFAWAPGWNSPQAWNKFQDEVGGHLRAGDPGVRLIAPVTASEARYYDEVPAATVRAEGEWRVLPLYHLYGSDELSSRAEVVAERIPAPYVLLSAADAATLDVAEGARVKVQIGNASTQLPVRISAQLAAGCIGLPSGLPGAVFAVLSFAAPASRVAKVSKGA